MWVMFLLYDLRHSYLDMPRCSCLFFLWRMPFQGVMPACPRTQLFHINYSVVIRIKSVVKAVLIDTQGVWYADLTFSDKYVAWRFRKYILKWLITDDNYTHSPSGFWMPKCLFFPFRSSCLLRKVPVIQIGPLFSPIVEWYQYWL